MNYNYFVDISSWFFISFVVSMFLGTALADFLEWLNSDIPRLKSKMDRLYSLGDVARRLFPFGKVRRSLEYKRVTERFSSMVDSVRSGLTTILLMMGVMPFMIDAFSHVLPGARIVWCWILASIVSALGAMVISVPVDYFRTFNIEERFGFNLSSTRTFVMDNMKSLLGGIALMVPLQLLFDYMLRTFGDMDRIGLVSFVVSMVVIGYILNSVSMYCILPLFNKFKPLENESLRLKLEDLCRRCGLKRVSLEVMDASKRSKHSNAFIFGVFGKKRIVLFDTILENMTEDEIVAIVAHEIGHGKLHHIAIKNVQSILCLMVATAITFSLMKTVSFYRAFGFSWVDQTNINENLIVGFGVAMTFLAAFSWILCPITNWVSRKMEYAADRYSCEVTDNPTALATALIKLSSENLSNLFPHPAYEFFNYSHPSIVPRVRKILEWK